MYFVLIRQSFQSMKLTEFCWKKKDFNSCYKTYWNVELLMMMFFFLTLNFLITVHQMAHWTINGHSVAALNWWPAIRNDLFVYHICYFHPNVKQLNKIFGNFSTIIVDMYLMNWIYGIHGCTPAIIPFLTKFTRTTTHDI